MPDQHINLEGECCMEKAAKAWHCQGRQELTKTKNSHSQANRLSTGTTHRSSPGLHHKINPQSCRIPATNTAALTVHTSNALGQHCADPAGPLSGSSQQTQPGAPRRRVLGVPRFAVLLRRPTAAPTWGRQHLRAALLVALTMCVGRE